MKRLRMRSIGYVCVAGACICGGMLVQAGPMGFVSRIWKERPVVLQSKESRLNPVNWFRRNKTDDADDRGPVAKTEKIERPELIGDPFLGDTTVADTISPQAAPEVEVKLAKPYREPGTEARGIRAPLVVERNVAASRDADIRRPQPGKPTRPAPRQPPVTSPDRARLNVNSATAQRAPRLPDLGAAASAARTEAGPQPAAPPRRPVAQKSQPRQKASAGNNNQFVGGFDAEFAKLVQSVIAETEQESVSAPAPRLPAGSSNGRTAPSLMQSFAELEGSNSEPAPSVPEFAPLPAQGPGLDKLPIASTTAAGEFSTEDERTEFARYGRQLTGSSITDVIDASRQRISNTPLATQRNVSREQLTAGQFSDEPIRQIDSSDPAAGLAPSPRLEMLDAPIMQITPGRAGSGVIIESANSRPIRPRVTSNGAPRRTVPDTSAVERLSYQTDETLADGSLPDIGDAPLRLPAEDGLNGQQFMNRAGEANRGLAEAESAAMPAINFEFPTETDIALEEPSSGIGWAIAVICLILAVAVGGYLARRKLSIDSFDLSRIRPRFEKE